MREQFRVIGKGLLHLLYPVRCPICDGLVHVAPWEDRYPICEACKKRVEYVREPSCKRCGKPITDERGEFCGDCQHKSHAFAQGKALLVYRGDAKQSIYRLKYSNRREYGLSFGQELARAYGGWIQGRGIDMVIPIPLHKRKLRERGYNQAGIIARELGRVLGLPVREDVLVRSIYTRPQKELNDKERKNNLRKAFQVTKSIVDSKRILLVDDIYTTGSTMDGASEALLGAGASAVYFVSASIGRGH